MNRILTINKFFAGWISVAVLLMFLCMVIARAAEIQTDIEKGKLTTAVAAYMGALWALGLLEGFAVVADPDQDLEGKTLEAARSPTTAPKRTKVFDDDF